MAKLDKENEIRCRNLTAEEYIEYIYTDIDFILIVICIPVICILGLFLNLAFLFVLYRVRDMRTTTNVYLGNLAVADSITLLIRLVRYVSTYFYSSLDLIFNTYFNNSITCGLPLLLINFSGIVSIFFISLVALERYNSVCRPLTHRRVSSKLRTMKYTLLAWILPFIFVSCHMGSFDLQKGCFSLPSSSSSVHYKVCPWERWVAISIILFVECQFWTAFIGNCTIYIAIVRKLSVRNRSTVLNKNTQERNHVAKMLIINACVFFICLIPMQVHVLFVLIDKLSNLKLLQLLPTSFSWIAVVASVMNSAVNPLIYGAANPNYRKAFREAFFSSCSTPRADILAIELRRKDVEV